MNKAFSLLLLGLCLGTTAHAQTLDEFQELLQGGDTIAQLNLLKKWEKTGSNNPDYYIAGFNYHVNVAHKEGISLQSTPGDSEESLALSDSTGTVGYLTGTEYYDEGHVNKALDFIDAGIKKFPKRLDMRFGKVYLLGKVSYKSFVKEIVTTLDYHAKIKGKWLWTDNKTIEEANIKVPDNLHSYCLVLYNAEDDSLMPDMLQVAEAGLKQFPNDVVLLSDASIAHMLMNQYDKGLVYMLRAEKIDPEDTIVLSNIALAYKNLADIANAKTYYNKIIAVGDADAQKYAKAELAKLN
ncbi:MAG: hypothetical protein V4581_13925 [Bacteroidota bacterium]